MKCTVEKGFTLVELIVVITILAILGTIGFVSFQGFSEGSRNTVRSSNIKTLDKAFILKISQGEDLKQYAIPGGEVPGALVGGQTTSSNYIAGDIDFIKLGAVKEDYKDPTTEDLPKLGVVGDASGQRYQVVTTLENGQGGISLILGNYSPRGTTSYSGTGSAGSNEINIGSEVYRFRVGDSVTGAGIPANTRIQGINGESIELSSALTATAANIALIQPEVAGLLNTSGSVVADPVINGSTTTLVYSIGTGGTNTIDCYDVASIGSVGNSGDCNGMLIVNKSMLDNAIINNPINSGEDYYIEHAGTQYTFGDSANNIFTGQVTDMTSLFASRSNFNADIGYWDVSNVTNMFFAFSGTGGFNQDISSWDVSSVTNMAGMFQYSAINHSLNNWNVSNVMNMGSMFWGAYLYNHPLNNWDVSSVTNMHTMFRSSFAFDQDISTWTVDPNVTNCADFDTGANISWITAEKPNFSCFVSDTTPPIITLTLGTPINFNTGDFYLNPGATANDDIDGDITGDIVVGGDSVDINTAGTYVITYNVSDGAGNAATEVTQIIIVTN